MINALRIYSHSIIDLIAGEAINPDFLVTENLYHVQNRVTNLGDVAITSGKVLASMVTGSIGGSGKNNQSQAVDPGIWLPRFRNSEASDMAQLAPYERMTFSYFSLIAPGGETLERIQTTFLGHLDYEPRYDVVQGRPFLYATPDHTLGAFVGASATDTITIEPGYDNNLLVKAFFSRFHGSQVSVNIRDLGTGYSITNTPVLTNNIAFDFLTENNYRPLPFLPWIAPERHSYEITWVNLTGDSNIVVNFAIFGNLCSYKIK